MIAFGDNVRDYDGFPFTLAITDNPDNTLSIVVALPTTGNAANGNDAPVIDETEALNEILKKAVPIYPDDSHVYEITFERYILYQTRNESYCSMDCHEKRHGTYFVIYTQSRLLDYLSQLTDCQIHSDGAYYPGEWKHYGILTNNHVIDIISDHEPKIRELQDSK